MRRVSSIGNDDETTMKKALFTLFLFRLVVGLVVLVVNNLRPAGKRRRGPNHRLVNDGVPGRGLKALPGPRRLIAASTR